MSPDLKIPGLLTAVWLLPATIPAERATPKSFGVTRFEPGTRVEHMMFGLGTVMAAKDMGGDVLYTVRFDDGQEKRLMATFAKLKRIN